MASSRKTKGRLRPWVSCGHKGRGIVCHRCADGNQILQRIEELKGSLKKLSPTTLLPYMEMNGTAVKVRAGARSWTREVSEKTNLSTAVASMFGDMKQYATHLLPAQKSLAATKSDSE